MIKCPYCKYLVEPKLNDFEMNNNLVTGTCPLCQALLTSKDLQEERKMIE
ncbi:MAG: hypothetical protein WC306_00485 [Candidatus Paceibacterota bacterium]|jgi:hypothetical protein